MVVAGVLSAVCAVTSARAAESGPVRIHICAEKDRNILRNGSFEFSNVYNGMKTIIDQGDSLTATWAIGLHRTWCDLGLEQWWGEGATNAALFTKTGDAHAGRSALAVTAPGVLTTWLAYAESWPKDGAEAVTLSWQAKGAATVKAEVAVYEGAAGLAQERRQHVGGKDFTVKGEAWTRETFTLEIPARYRRLNKAAFQVRFAVQSGTCAFDEVQLECGRIATAFTERQSHFLALALEGTSTRELPKIRRGDTSVQRLYVRNTSGRMLTGALRLFLDTWDAPGRTVLAETRCIDWKAGETKSFPLTPGRMAPNAYVVLASFEPYFSERGVFDSANTGWGNVGKSMLMKRNGLRFAVFPETLPKDLFGVGNGMVGHDGWWSGNTVSNAVRARSIHPVLLGEADPYKAAIIGAPNIVETQLGGRSPQSLPEACNPAFPNMINVYSPNGRRLLKEGAVAFGARVADDPSVAGAKLDNEGFFVNRGNFCPDKWADLDFRNWLKRRYENDLGKLNAAWKTSFGKWDDVQQPISSVKDGTIQKTGGAALDWTASMGKMTKESQARLAANPAMALDWFRWRAFSVIRLYDDFIRDAHTVDTKTLYGNNYPWPNYFTHIIWPQWRTHDVIMLDQQYVCGFPRTLGTNEEMIDILEQAESVSRGERPIWGREIYFQPNYPGEMAALQNWAMIAHGMSVPMTFAWRPYADYRREIFKTGTKSWLKDDAPPMWFLIDVDGSEVPGYAPNARATDEIAAFHRKYDGLSLVRTRGDVALYLSTDTSAYIMYETFDKPYASPLSRTRASLAAALRYAGARIEYFDDATLGEVDPKRFPVLIAPGERMVGDRALAQLRAYAEKGGRLIVLNDFNTLDVNGNTKSIPGVAGWKGDVRAVKDFVAKYDTKPYNTRQHDEQIAKFLTDHAIPRPAWWENETPRREGEEKLLAGEGRPLVEVVVRTQKKTGRKFFFVLNKGGAGRGRLRGSDFADVELLTDALTGAQSSLDFSLPAFGYRVFTTGK